MTALLGVGAAIIFVMMAIMFLLSGMAFEDETDDVSALMALAGVALGVMYTGVILVYF